MVALYIYIALTRVKSIS